MTTEITELIARPPKIAKDGRVMSPKSLANLNPPYQPGTNGHGRVYPLKERLQHALDKPLTKPKDDAPAGDYVVYATLKGAIDLVPIAVRETWDRVEGKVLEKHAIVGDILIEVVYGNRYSSSNEDTGQLTRASSLAVTNTPEQG